MKKKLEIYLKCCLENILLVILKYSIIDKTLNKIKKYVEIKFDLTIKNNKNNKMIDVYKRSLIFFLIILHQNFFLFF